MNSLIKLKLSDYDALIANGVFSRPERQCIELIDGKLREMAPIGPMHEDLINFLTEWSYSNKPDHVSIRVQCSIGLPEYDSAPEPDLAWVHKGRYTKQRPEAADVLLAIEVSHSSIAFDLGQKKGLYARAGGPEYWVIDVATRRILVFRQPADNDYKDSRIVDVGETVAPLAEARAELDVRELFAEECQ